MKIEDPFQQFVVSLVLGLLVGLQRQWADNSPVAGIRTFSLISLLGTVCAFLTDEFGDGVIALGFIGTIGATIIGRFSKITDSTERTSQPGLVNEFAMLLMYLSGVLVNVGPTWLAASLAGVLAVVLQAKIELHDLVLKFSAKEINAIMRFVLISMVILPIVPNHPLGPMNVLNLYDIWLMVVFIVAIGLLGYMGYKFFGARAGVLLGGILGGLISSTATTVTYAKRAGGREGLISQSALVILIAWTMLYIRVFVEILVVAPNFKAAFMPIGILFVTSVLATLWLWRGSEKNHQGMPPQSNPTELKTALTFAILYSLILLSVAYAKQRMGGAGLMVISMLSGITDVDAITLSMSRMVGTDKMSPDEGWPLIVAAITANIFFKGVLIGVLGGRDLFKKIFISWFLSLLAGTLLLWFW